jgi:hypothetical protein
MERVKVYRSSGSPVKTWVGLFARVFIEHFPLLPVEDEGRLHDPALRENFIFTFISLGKIWTTVIQVIPRSSEKAENIFQALRPPFKYRICQIWSIIQASKDEE